MEPAGANGAAFRRRLIVGLSVLSVPTTALMVLYLIEGRMENGPVIMQASLYGSVLPAAWSFMLAARARGLGSAWTTIHLFFEKEASELLGIPETFTQTVLLPVAYFKGEDFKPAHRVSPRELTYWNQWGKTRA